MKSFCNLYTSAASIKSIIYHHLHIYLHVHFMGLGKVISSYACRNRMNKRKRAKKQDTRTPELDRIGMNWIYDMQSLILQLSFSWA